MEVEVELAAVWRLYRQQPPAAVASVVAAGKTPGPANINATEFDSDFRTFLHDFRDLPQIGHVSRGQA